MGLPLADVIQRSSWNPAREIKREEFGHLTVGGPADVTVLRLEKGNFGFVDSNGARMRGKEKLICEMTVLGGRVVWDLNGLTRENWDKLDKRYGPPGRLQMGWHSGPLSAPNGREFPNGAHTTSAICGSWRGGSWRYPP